MATAKKTARKPAAKRELIEPHKGDKRYVRRGDGGEFDESDDVSKSLAQDVRTSAKTTAKAGQGDRGDHTPAAKKAVSKKAASKKTASKKTASKKTASKQSASR